LYSSKGVLSDIPLDQKTMSVELHPGTDTRVAYDLSNETESAYYLEGKLSDGRGTIYFDVLLDSGNAAFPWAGCVDMGGPATPPASTKRLLAATGVLIIIIGGLYAIRAQRVHVSRRG
jgi:hypothetical protein